MNRDEKRLYNQQHYLKHREKALAKAQARKKKQAQVQENVFEIVPGVGSLAPPQAPKGPPRKQPRRRFSWEALMLSALICILTYYLVTEATAFFGETEGNGPRAILKALMVEVIVIAFAFFTVRSRWLRIAHKVLLVVACLYSLGAVSGNTVTHFTVDRKVAIQSEAETRELETEVSRRRVLRDRFVALDRLSAAKEYEASLDKLQSRLAESRKNANHQGNMLRLIYSVGVLIVFRALVLFANVLCVHRLSWVFRSKGRNQALS